MDLTPEEILKVKTKGTLNIIPDSPLHNAVISAMIYYANQEVKKLTIPLVVGQSEQLKPEFPEDRITKHQEG